jgi:hypothetical protein
MAETGDLVAAEFEAPGLPTSSVESPNTYTAGTLRSTSLLGRTAPSRRVTTRAADLLCWRRRTCSVGTAATGRFLSADEGTDGPGWWLTKPVAAGAVHDNVDERPY